MLATLASFSLILLFSGYVSAQGLQPISLQRFARKAVDLYFEENYEEAIKNFEHVLVHYRMLKSIDTVCGMRCNSPNISKEIGMDFSGFDELYAYGNLIAQANCIKICKEEHPFSKPKIERPPEDYVRDFEKRLQYNYLQFAYYKTGDMDKASQAAFTYLQANPGDEQMKENIAYYRALGTNDKHFNDLEGQPYQEFFRKGVEYYEDEKYAEAVKNMEQSLADYVIVLDECKALCYVERDPETFHGLSIAIAFRYQPVIECCMKCEEKTRPVVKGNFVDNFIPLIYSYLQFAYFQLKDYKMAAPAAASVSLLDPNDEMAISNMQYYKENAEELELDVNSHFIPRPEAIKFYLDRKRESKLLDLIKKVTDYEDEEDVESDEEDGSLSDLVQSISRQIVMELGENLRGDTG